MPDRFEGPSTYFDTWSTVAAAFLGPVGSIDEPLMDYRVHGSNAAGGSIDFGRFVSCWTMTGRLVDHWAERTGDPSPSDVDHRDGRLVLFRFLDGEPVPVRRRITSVAVAPIESFDIGAGVGRDGGEHAGADRDGVLATPGCSAVKRLGLRRWARDAAPSAR
jgi:hypothetical protein